MVSKTMLNILASSGEADRIRPFSWSKHQLQENVSHKYLKSISPGLLNRELSYCKEPK
jgi:hypothetical protein